LDTDQSREVLCFGLPGLDAGQRDRLLSMTGGWALALKAANSALRVAVRDGRALNQTVRWLADTLASDGPDVLNLGRERGRDKTIAATLQASMALLPESDRARYLELGIFAEDSDIDFGVVSLLWGATGRVGVRDARRLVAALHEQSLVTDFRPETGSLRLHDVVRAYLREQLGPERVKATHGLLLTVAARHHALPIESDGLRAWWALPASADYLWRHVAGHLAGAGLRGELNELLGDLRWFSAKIRAAGPAAIEADLAFGDGPTIAALRRAVWLEGQVLAPVTPIHSHDDVVIARLAGDARLVDVITRFRSGLAGGVTRLRPGWPLPDAADPAALRVLVDLDEPPPPSWHQFRVSRGLAIAPDGTWLAAATRDGGIRIWDLRTATLRSTLPGHQREVRAVRIAPDGTWLASVGSDGAVRIWDAASGALSRTLSGHTGSVSSLDMSPDGTWLITGGVDKTARLWDVAAGHQRQVLQHSADIDNVRVAHNGRWFATHANPDGLRIYDVGATTPRLSFGIVRGGVMDVAIAPDGRWLAAALMDGTTEVRDPATGTSLRTIRGNGSILWAVAIAPDGSWLATAGSDSAVRVWDAASSELLSTLTGHTESVTDLAVARDGTWFASRTTGTVRTWRASAERRTPEAGHPDRIRRLRVDPDGRSVTTAGWGTVCVWDAQTGNCVQTLGASAGAASPDRRLLALTSHKHDTIIYEVGGALRHTLSGHTKRITDVAFAATSSWIATAAEDDTVRVWDLATGTQRLTLPVKGARRVLAAPDNTWLATVGQDGLRIWDVGTGTARAEVKGVMDVAAAPNGRWFATVGPGVLRLLDATTFAVIAERLQARTGPPPAPPELEAMPRGLSAEAVQALTLALTVQSMHEDIACVAISPDGRWLATGGAYLRLWNAATLANSATMRLAAGVSGVAIDAAGDAVYCSSGDFGRPFRFNIR
jgi:WD40 repeat protein